MMHAETVIVVAFSVANVLRLLAYLPQIVLLVRQNDTSAISSATWSLFLVSNAVTALYAARVAADPAMCLAFLANTLCCAAIVALVYAKRRKSPPCERLAPSAAGALAGGGGERRVQPTFGERLGRPPAVGTN
jgi:uncharacterized protein with PQ loop repeat